MLKRWWSGLFRRKRPFKLTKPGWIFILYTIGVGAGAINTGNNLLYLVFGVFLGLILASGFLSDLSLWGVEVEYTFPHSAEVGQPVSIFLNVKNEKRFFPALSAHVTLEGTLRNSAVHLKKHVPFVQVLSTSSIRLEWSPSQRGWYQQDSIRLSTRFPFSLLEKWWVLKSEVQRKDGFFITPKIYDLDINILPIRRRGDDDFPEDQERGDGPVLKGIHPYHVGDNPRRIHWKSSVKRSPVFVGDSSVWMVREMEKEQREEALFICQSQKFSDLPQIELEKRISFLASTIVSCRSEGLIVRVQVDGRIVQDEEGFLAMWNPLKGNDADIERYLGETVDEALFSTWMDLEEAYRVVHAG